MRVAPVVVLSPEERACLYRWSRRDARHDPRSLRARIVLGAADGLQDVEIGRKIRVSRLTAARWRRRFLSERLRGIDHPHSRGLRSGSIPEEQIHSIVRAVTTRNPEGNRAWSTRTLGHALGVSHSTVRRVWEAYRVRPIRHEPWPPRPDPSLPLVPTDVVGVYLRPPDYAVVFSLGTVAYSLTAAGESPQVRAGIPGGFNRLLRDVAQPSFSPSETRLRPFLRFLGELGPRMSRSPELQIVATIPGVVESPIFERWRTRHPQARFEFLSDAESWKSRLLVHLAEVGRHSPGSRTLEGRGELARALQLFFTSYSAESGPFEWVASSQELASEESGFRLRYELSVTGHTGFKKPSSVPPSMRTAGVADPRARELARLVLRKSLKLHTGEQVTIESWTETLEFANAFVLEALRVGARPLLVYKDEPTYWAAVSEVRPGNLARLGEHLRAAVRRSDVLVSFFGPSDRERAHSLSKATQWRLGEYQDALYDAAAKAGARAVQIALGRASEASARMYGVNLETWRNELIDASLVSPDELHRRAIRVADRLRRGREITIRHSNGTELKLGLKHRSPEVSDGRVAPASEKGRWNLVQLPGGVVTVALDEEIAEGVLRSNVPNSVGVMDSIGEMVGGRWTFERGRLARYNYEQGHDLFAQSYERASAGRDRPGTLSIGLNERIAISPLLMDQALGTITLQLGRNDHAGGTNHVFWWAWLILRGADLAIDGKWLLKGGKLVP